jgi:hypothetical protein
MGICFVFNTQCYLSISALLSSRLAGHATNREVGLHCGGKSVALKAMLLVASRHTSPAVRMSLKWRW